MPANEQGVTDDRYKIIPRTLIFLTRGDHILMIKGSAEKRLWSNKYNGIGGHVERDESVLDAAKRELWEETGLTPDEIWLCGIITVDTGLRTGIGIFVFRGECPHGGLKKTSEGDLVWVKENDYTDLPLVKDLYVLLPRIMAMRKGASPFFAHTRYDDQGLMRLSFSN